MRYVTLYKVRLELQSHFTICMHAVHTYECDTIQAYELDTIAIHTSGVATISRLPNNIGFFCKRAL